MTVTLTPEWALTTDHSASSYSIPVLIKREENTAYGPLDHVVHGNIHTTARELVRLLLRGARLHTEAQRFVNLFIH